jgi:hypothetical protein
VREGKRENCDDGLRMKKRKKEEGRRGGLRGKKRKS